MKLLGRIARRLGLALAGLVVLVAVAAAGAFGLAQTETGKAWIATRLAAAASSPGTSVAIEGLRGTIPFDLAVDRIAIADTGGTWLTLEKVALEIAPQGLLAGRLDIRLAAAERIAVARQPAASRASPSSSEPLRLPHLPLAIRLASLHVDRLELGAPLLGEPAAVAITGDGTLESGAATANLALRRVDGPAGHGELALSFGGSPAQLRLKAEVAEPSGLALDTLFGRTDHLPFSLALAGDGPLGDWHGRLVMAGGDQARIDADFAIAEQEGYHLTAGGNAAVARLLPPDVAPLLGASVPFSARIGFLEDGRLQVESLRLDTALAELDAGGSVDPATKDISGRATLTLADLAPLAPLLGKAVAGAATLQLAVAGKLDAPQLQAVLSAQRLRFDQSGIGQATLTVDAKAAGDPSDAATRIEVSGNGHLAGVTAGGPLPAGTGDAIDLSFTGSGDRAGTAFALTGLDVTAPGLRLTGTARGGAGAIIGHAVLSVADLARFRDLAGHDLAGSLDLTLDLAGGGGGGALTATLSGSAERLASGIPVIDRLVGPRPQLHAVLRRGADGALTLSELEANGAKLKANASASLPAGSDALSARYRIELPDLAAVGAALDTPLAGRVTVAGDLAAALRASPLVPSGNATIEGEGLAFGGRRMDRLTARLKLAGAPSPAIPSPAAPSPAAPSPATAGLSGSLDLDFRAGALAGTAATDFALAQGNVLNLSRLRLAAGSTRLDGDLRVALDRGLVSGRIGGRIPDLKPWSALAGTPLAGHAELDAKLDATRGQAVELTLTGSDLALGGGGGEGDAATLRKLRLEARLADLLGQPSGKASLAVEGATAGAARLASLHLAAEAPRAGRFSVTGEAHGRFRQKIDLSLAAEAGVSEGAMNLRLTRLTGALGDTPLRLARPLTVTRKGESLAVTDLALGLGSGELSGGASLTRGAITLHLLAKRLPVRMLARFGSPQEVTGELGFEASLSGTPARPEGQLVIDAEQLRLIAPTHSDLPPVGLVASAQWRDRRVEIRGRAAGPKDAAVGFTGTAPLVLDPQSLALTLPPGGALSLRVEGQGDLANLADLLPLGEDILAGRFAIDVNVDGTVGQPAAHGRLTLRDGSYTSFVAGATYSGIHFDLVGDRDRFVLQNFAASDGGGGTLVASGALALAAKPLPTIDFHAELKGFEAAKRDDARISTSGTIQVAGDIATPKVTAAIRVDHGEFGLPDRLPVSVRPIAAVVIDSGQQISPAPGATETTPVMVSVGLDIRVDLPGQIFVRGRGLDSEWRGSLAISGTSAAPEITGALSVVRGSYSFLGKSFNLTRGVISFSGANPPDPQLDLVAEASSADVTAQVRIGGTAKAPDIKLSSVPELPQDEVLSRVLFGQGMSQITPAQGLQVAQAAASLAGGGIGILDRVRQRLGLDLLSFGSAGSTSTNQGLPTIGGNPGSGLGSGVGNAPLTSTGTSSTSSSSTSSSALNAGKYLADGVYVGVSQGLAPGSSRVTVNVEVAKHITVETDAGQSGDAGVGVNWKLDY